MPKFQTLLGIVVVVCVVGDDDDVGRRRCGGCLSGDLRTGVGDRICDKNVAIPNGWGGSII